MVGSKYTLVSGATKDMLCLMNLWKPHVMPLVLKKSGTLTLADEKVGEILSYVNSLWRVWDGIVCSVVRPLKRVLLRVELGAEDGQVMVLNQGHILQLVEVPARRQHLEVF